MGVLRVATYNIRHGEGMDGRVDLARTAHVIGALKADVVALQEVDRGWERSGKVDQVAELERMTGLHIRFWPTVVREDGAEYGIAVAGPALLEASFEMLPRIGTEEPRGVIRIEAPGVTLLATHLSRARKARAVQTDRLGAMASSVGPVVVMGDLNQARRYLRPLHEAGLHEGAARLRTLPSTRPRRQVDHVLAGGGARVTTAWTPRTTASDHCPLVAVVEIPSS
jgi:endonuclease/exonuclease/phosphatase family metal-dependent hydrolase